jgi:squalene synthase HpnC
MRAVGALTGDPQAVSPEGVPPDGVPQDGVPPDGVPQDGAPQDGVPPDSAAPPGGAVSANGGRSSATGADGRAWPSAAAVMARAGTENFPVASRLLGEPACSHLLAIYGFARLVDELGDAHAGDRLAALDWVQGELDRAYDGTAEHPLMAALAGTVAACRLPREPFGRLIEANRVDQRVARYESFAELRAYCALSADPVGELVLGVFGVATPERVALSDAVCTALQLAEHWQDIGEDRARGRVYLPAEDMRAFGVSEADLDAAHASSRLRALLAFEVQRARSLLISGAPLLGTLSGRQRLAVAGFMGGGWAALGAIQRARYDVLPGPPRAGGARRVAAAMAVLTLPRTPSSA